ncbi:MAG: hypothetical protein WBZ19_18100 [Chthoniobacterales bacterium]
MNIDTDFPTKVQTVDDLPEPLRHVLKDNIPPNKQARLIIYSRLFSTLDDLSPVPAWPVTIFAPATVLAVLEDGWVLVTDGEDGIEVENSKFSDTLFLELTSILLSGELKIHFASVGTYYATSIPFNTVREELYREAMGLILNGIDQTVSVKTWPNNQRQPLLQTWPMKFRLEAERYRPNDQSLITATRWNAVTGGFERDLSPAGALLVTSRSLISILEQKTAQRQHPGDLHKFGGIITYFPIARLSDYHISHHGRFGVLALQVRAAHGAEKLEILFPSDREKAVSNTVQWAFAKNQ